MMMSSMKGKRSKIRRGIAAFTFENSEVSIVSASGVAASWTRAFGP